MRIKYNVTVFITLILFILSSCGSANELDDKTMEATIQAAIAATESVQNEVNDLISGSVSATLTAIPSPTPISVDQLSEEEFASALEQSTDEAVSTADNATQYASSASDDGELTQEEIDELYYLYYASVDELEQALYLVDIYYDLYDELLATVITDLESIEGDFYSKIDEKFPGLLEKQVEVENVRIEIQDLTREAEILQTLHSQVIPRLQAAEEAFLDGRLQDAEQELKAVPGNLSDVPVWHIG